MKVFLSQIYVQVGIAYPFTYHFQRWIGENLSQLLGDDPSWRISYPKIKELVIRLSAKSEIEHASIVGPTYFKKDDSLEYTIFLPWDEYQKSQYARKVAMQVLFQGLMDLVELCSVKSEQLKNSTPALVSEAVVTDRFWEIVKLKH